MGLAALTSRSIGRPGEICIHPWSFQSIGLEIRTSNSGNPGSQNWPAANVGVFIPFTIPEPVTFTKMFWGNGSAVAGNIDVGLFDESGTRLVSIGTTAQATVSTIQVVDITDTTLARGRWYLGMTSDTSGATQKVLQAVPVGGICQAFGLLKDTSCAPPLSTNANPATYVAYDLASIPLVGVMGYRTFGP